MIVKLLLLGIVSSVYSQSFHHTITSEDLEHVFSVKNAAEVPGYDIVPISIRKTRSLGMNKSFHFQQPFGRRLKMWLTPSDGTLFSRNLPVSFISYDRFAPDRLRETKSKLNYDDTFFYENKFYATTLAVNYHTNGRYSVNIVLERFHR
ncbi:uncharacterized protein LOC141536356 [Cotesia typhae]|uniref:uncharacterized protein LOC141536356 n=1 Tax=Cotesia typhae TaxID=2053667 RepID=UPI003D682400